MSKSISNKPSVSLLLNLMLHWIILFTVYKSVSLRISSKLQILYFISVEVSLIIHFILSFFTIGARNHLSSFFSDGAIL